MHGWACGLFAAPRCSACSYCPAMVMQTCMSMGAYASRSPTSHQCMQGVRAPFALKSHTQQQAAHVFSDNDSVQVWEQRRDQARASWRALRARLDAYVRAAAAERPPPSPLQQPAARGSGFLGVPALAAGRAAARPTLTAVSRAGGGGGGGSGDAGGGTPGGGAPPSQLDKLRTLLQAQNDAITTARGRLDELCTELAVWKQEHPDMVLPRRLRSHLTAA